jgi:hypothetical protein
MLRGSNSYRYLYPSLRSTYASFRTVGKKLLGEGGDGRDGVWSLGGMLNKSVARGTSYRYLVSIRDPEAAKRMVKTDRQRGFAWMTELVGSCEIMSIVAVSTQCSIPS